MKKEKKKKSEEKKGENKKGSGCAGGRAFVAAIASVLSAAQVSIKGERPDVGHNGMCNITHATQTKAQRKTKGSDEKEATGNELLGMPFLGMTTSTSLITQSTLGMERPMSNITAINVFCY